MQEYMLKVSKSAKGDVGKWLGLSAALWVVAALLGAGLGGVLALRGWTGSGLALEKKLDPQKSIVGQKEQLLGVFEAALARAAAITA